MRLKVQLLLVGVRDISRAPALTGEQEGQTEGGVDGDRGEAVEVARDQDYATEVVEGGIVRHVLGVHAVEGAEELLVDLVDRLILVGEADDGAQVVSR